MIGVDDFVAHNLGKHDSTFDSCLHLIVYAYSLIDNSKPYSRKEILDITSEVRGREANRIELEDYLRNDLITKYINPHLSLFNLKWFYFQSGAEEFERNIRKGILDIKVSSPTLDGTVYYIFECKRMNKGIADNYVKEGVKRFIEAQYYPESDITSAGLISFLEAETKANRIECSLSFKIYEDLLGKYSDDIQIKKPLRKYKLACDFSSFVENFEHVYVSSHGREKGKNDIDLYHIILDYNSLIIQ